MPIGWSPRSYTAMRRDLGGGLRETRCYAGHQFYKDAADDWQDVDYTLVDMGSFWELSKASYRLRIAKDFGAAALLQFTNRYEGANHTITYEPHSIWWINADNKSQRTQFRAAQAVTGVYDPVAQTVTWTNAFGAGVDFEVVIRRSGFQKNIVAKATPPVAPYANAWLMPVFKWTATGLTLKDTAGGDWDNNSYLEADEFTVEETGNRALRSFIRPAQATDADGRSRQLRVLFEKRQGALWQGKIIPDDLLRQATYPVRADTVTDFYAGVGDGDVSRAGSPNTTWAIAHDTVDGNGVNYTDTVTTPSTFHFAYWGMARSFLPIDTSAIPATDIISAANLNLYVPAKINDDNDGDDWITIVQTKQAASAILVVGDYDECGESAGSGWSNAFQTDIIEGIATGDRKDITGISTGAYLSIPLNAIGLAWVARNGETKPPGAANAGITFLGIREGHDVLNSEIAGASVSNNVNVYMSERVGTAQDPYLSVTHAAAGRRIFITHW